MSEGTIQPPSSNAAQRIALHGWEHMTSVASPIATASWTHLVFQLEANNRVPDEETLCLSPEGPRRVSRLGRSHENSTTQAQTKLFEVHG